MELTSETREQVQCLFYPLIPPSSEEVQILVFFTSQLHWQHKPLFAKHKKHPICLMPGWLVQYHGYRGNQGLLLSWLPLLAVSNLKSRATCCSTDSCRGEFCQNRLFYCFIHEASSAADTRSHLLLLFAFLFFPVDQWSPKLGNFKTHELAGEF